MGVSGSGPAGKLPHDSRWRPIAPGRYLLAATVVAVLDISFAATYWVVVRAAITFPQLLRSIASGVLGDAAARGGAGAAVLGAMLHGAVACGWALVFIGVRRWWPAFDRALQRPAGRVAAGLLFGMMVWLVMDLAVLPLTRARPTPIGSSWFRVSLVWHAIGVGLPLAFILGPEPERR